MWMRLTRMPERLRTVSGGGVCSGCGGGCNVL